MTEPRRLTILAIDDDPLDLELLRGQLDEIPWLEVELIARTQASEGRRELATRAIDLVFLDYRLGAEDGLEVLKTIRHAGNTCPIIFLTGKGSELLAAESRRAGCDDYLMKQDLTSERLSESISYVLDAHAAEQDQAAFEEMLTRLASEDSVTGLLNRRSFMERFAGEIKRTERYERPLCLLAIDVDNFGRINDELGREAGDQILANIAVVLRGTLRTTDHFCRYRGDQFLVALTETDRALGVGAAERVHKYLRASAFAAGGEDQVAVTATVSLVVVDPANADPDRTLIDALATIGRGKANGGDCVVVADEAQIR